MQRLRQSLWLLLLLLLVTAILTLRPTVGWADDGEGEEDGYETGQVVVKLNPQSGATIEAINADYGTTTLKTLLGSTGIYLLQLPTGGEVEGTVEQMENDARLLYAEPNFTSQAPEGIGNGKWAWAGQDPTPTGTQYAANLLRMPEAHAISRGANTVVAVLDTGFQLDHSALASRLTAARYDFVDDDPVPDEAFAALDTNGDGIVDGVAGHGTHVASLVQLAAPDAQIMPLRVLDANGQGNVFLIAEAVLYAAQQGADVINLSLGTSASSSLLAETIADVVQNQDVVVVAAAGNLNTSSEQYPAAAAHVIAVTAVDATQAKASFANYGGWVDLATPGDAIYGAFPMGGYAYWSGTSMAAPFLAGQTALLRSLAPALPPETVLCHIQSTAQPLAAGLGAGLADFAASLQSLSNPCGEGGGDGDDDGDGDEDGDSEARTRQPAGSAGNTVVSQIYLPVVVR